MRRRFPRLSVSVVFCLCLLCAPAAHSEILEKDLDDLLEPLREKYDMPALAAAVILEGRTVALGSVGVRKYGGNAEVTHDDAFHLGSCTKTMTATLIAMLVEQGELRWNTTLAEVFPELVGDMRPSYRKVNLKHLLSHRAGLPPIMPVERNWPKDMTFRDVHRIPGSPREQRTAYVRLMLREPPEAAPGKKYIYSNVGYAVAGAIAERVMDTAWEDLMTDMIFGPLDMETAGFGAMGSPGKVDQPWQHRLENNKRRPISPGVFSDNPPAIGPAATVHCSIGDWAKFIGSQLKGARGAKALLRPKTLNVLQTPPFGDDCALGWHVTRRPWGRGPVLYHSGSNRSNFAVVWMAPQRHFAVLVATNQGGDKMSEACDEVAWLLIQKFLLSD